MSSYKELMEQAKKLMAQAEEARQLEMADAVSDVIGKMKAHGITLNILRFAGAETGDDPAPSKRNSTPAKYRGPNGELWPGGRGRKPDWALKVLKEGGDLEQYRIKP